MKVKISEAARHLTINEDSLNILIKFHRIGVDNVDGEFIVRDEDIYYFEEYLKLHGKLPDLPKGTSYASHYNSEIKILS